MYEFCDGSLEDNVHLGLKGANLCEMAKYVKDATSYKLNINYLFIYALDCCLIMNIIQYRNRHNLPIPDGFIITAEACQDFFKGITTLTPHLLHNVKASVSKLEKKTGKAFFVAKSEDTPPLLLSIRSSTAVKLPGMTDTVLNLGINDVNCALLGKFYKDPK